MNPKNSEFINRELATTIAFFAVIAVLMLPP
jgi:hypothetical protein